MKTTNSPWISELARSRPLADFRHSLASDIAVVGGGIAGVATAYYILKHTDKNVVLLEADQIGHGATGHSAGQIVSYFERQFSRLAVRFGLELAARAQDAIDSAWALLDEIVADAKLKVPYSRFRGYAGCRNWDELMTHLNNRFYCSKAGVNSEYIQIARGFAGASQIPSQYQGLFSLTSHDEVLSHLETNDARYFAAIIATKGCMNAASFTEELVRYLLLSYSSRFQLGELSPVDRIVLQKRCAKLFLRDKSITARKVVLCTNGFERVKLVNEAGPDISVRFRRAVYGAVGYMSGYLEKGANHQAAISYLRTPMQPEYFHITRRPFRSSTGEQGNLVCVGGPETVMQDTRSYSQSDERFPYQAARSIDEFVHKTYKYAPRGGINYMFRWHGLMGYTPQGVRIIGPEPQNHVLLYNLGCNGVGILPSLYGAERISRILVGEQVERSIFDPT